MLQLRVLCPFSGCGSLVGDKGRGVHQRLTHLIEVQDFHHGQCIVWLLLKILFTNPAQTLVQYLGHQCNI